MLSKAVRLLLVLLATFFVVTAIYDAWYRTQIFTEFWFNPPSRHTAVQYQDFWESVSDMRFILPLCFAVICLCGSETLRRLKTRRASLKLVAQGGVE